jgi:hypothetical protein
MTKKTLIIATAIMMIAQITTATVWRVNNRPNADADFTTIQAAHDGATAGDILYIEGSPSSYGNLTCTKQLHIIGAGDFLNDNSETQAYKEVSIVGSIFFNSGSENSILEGVHVQSNSISINTSDITIRRNRIHSDSYVGSNLYGIIINTNAANILIENNWIYVNNVSGWNGYAIYSTGTGLTNLVIRNNFIFGWRSSTPDRALILSATVLSDNVAIYQNVITGFLNAKESLIYNNIMIDGTFTVNGSYYNNNIGNSTQFGTANGNQENVDMSTVFVDHTSGIDSDLQLTTGSPAIGAGWAGEDCGMYGGSYPYHISLLPAIPAVWEVTLNNYGSDVVPINVNIKAKAHN